jgi:hypothetical protein
MSIKLGDYPTVNFQGDCGEAKNNPYSATSNGLQPFQSVTINGGPPSNCMVSNDHGVIYSITLLSIPGIYDYQLAVEAQGPSGIGSGSFYLAFTDASGDTYYLSIFSSKKETHTVDYNSSAPAIVKIWWCDDSFDAPGASNKTTKADFRVTSPAK